MNTLTQTDGYRVPSPKPSQEAPRHTAQPSRGASILSRAQLHERLRSAKHLMDRAQSDLAYLDAKESFNDYARQLADLPLEGV